METIEIKIPSELYRRLRPYQKDLAHILELGLGYLEENPTALSKQATSASPEQVIAVLHQAGVLGADMATVTATVKLPENENWQPLQTSGEPASEIIIQQRREMSGD